MAKVLLDRGADQNKVDTEGETPLSYATQYVQYAQYADLVKLLTEAGAK